MNWQSCGWRCGYYCIYALLAAETELSTEGTEITRERQNDMLTKGLEDRWKMPLGFEHVIWSMLKIIEDSEETEWSLFFLNHFLLAGSEAQKILFTTTDEGKLETVAEEIKEEYRKFKEQTSNRVPERIVVA